MIEASAWLAALAESNADAHTYSMWFYPVAQPAGTCESLINEGFTVPLTTNETVAVSNPPRPSVIV